MKSSDIIKRLKALSNSKSIAGMARFGITPQKTYGVSIPHLRKLAKEIGVNHQLAQKLWLLNIRETRILAGMIDDPQIVTEKQIEKWVKEFDYWEICDQCCMNLFEKTGFAYEKCFLWSLSKKEFVKRAGFVLIARLAVSDRQAEDEKFEQFFPVIKRESIDERNMVKKAVNWALRQIGKRNCTLNKKAITVAEEIKKINSGSSRWIAVDAIRELTGRVVQRRLGRKARTGKSPITHKI